MTTWYTLEERFVPPITSHARALRNLRAAVDQLAQTRTVARARDLYDRIATANAQLAVIAQGYVPFRVAYTFVDHHKGEDIATTMTVWARDAEHAQRLACRNHGSHVSTTALPFRGPGFRYRKEPVRPAPDGF